MRTWVGNRDGGSVVAEDHAVISVLDHGFTVPDGVFETMKVTAAGPFALTRHLRRLSQSARALGLPTPDLDVVRGAVEAVIAAPPPGPAHRPARAPTRPRSSAGQDRRHRRRP